MGFSQKIQELLKKGNEITARQFIEQTPVEYGGKAAAWVLSALAALPVFVSATFVKNPELIEDVVDDQFSGIVYSTVFGSYWFHWLLVIGFFTALLSAFALAKYYYGRPASAESPWTWISRRWIPVCLGMLLLWSVLSALLSGDYATCFLGTSYRQEGVLTYFFYATVFISGILLTTGQMRRVAEVLVACCAVTGILVITGGKFIPGLFFLEEDLRAAMFHQYNHYGYFLAVCFPLCFGLVMDHDPRKPMLLVLRLAEFWLICNAVAFNSVRGSFLAILTAVAGWNIAVLVNHRSRWKLLLVLDFVFAAAILGLNTGSTLLSRFDVLFDQLKEVQQAIPAATEAAGSVSESGALNAMDNLGSERGLLWRLGIQFALQRPLFGYGPDNLGALYNAYRPGLVDRPHNELIQIAASLGIPALMFYLAALGRLAVSFFRCFRRLSLFQLGLFAAVGSYLVSSLFGNTMYYTTPYFYLVLAFAYQTGRDLPRQ